jgi:hypothetical protein
MRLRVYYVSYEILSSSYKDLIWDTWNTNSKCALILFASYCIIMVHRLNFVQDLQFCLARFSNQVTDDAWFHCVYLFLLVWFWVFIDDIHQPGFWRAEFGADFCDICYMKMVIMPLLCPEIFCSTKLEVWEFTDCDDLKYCNLKFSFQKPTMSVFIVTVREATEGNWDSEIMCHALWIFHISL